MPRKPLTEKRAHLHFTLDPRDRAAMDLHLYSEVEQRIPQGSHQRFLTERIREFFSWGTLDLTVLGGPQGYFVRGPKPMLEWLRERLTKGAAE